MYINKVPSGNVFLNPEKILNIAELKLGDKVADLGCGGAGYFILQAAKMVGPKGIAYGVDVLRPALSGLISRAKLEGLNNITPIWSNVEIYNGAKQIKNGSLDMALLINLLYQSKKHYEIFRETYRMLRKGGKAVVVDWRVSKAGFGPKKDEFVDAENIKSIALETGFKLTKTFVAGEYHYSLIFEKV